MNMQHRAPLRAAATIPFPLPVAFDNSQPLKLDYDQAFAYVQALTSADPMTTHVDVRCIHDQNRSLPAMSLRGTLPNLWSAICAWNLQGFGIFVAINQLDGIGRSLENVSAVRTHVVDLDNVSALQNYEHAAAWQPAPAFAVQTSPSKYHLYWPCVPYLDIELNSTIQRKLAAHFNGDPSVIDASRVLRLPGTYHQKTNVRHLVTCHALQGFSALTPPETLEAALAGVQVHESVHGRRHPLGEPSLAAPSKEWVEYALNNVDPNNLKRIEWISFTSAIKQAIWSHVSPNEAFEIWSKWCEKYHQNDPAENRKQFDSIKATEIGWPSIVRRVPEIAGQLRFGGHQHVIPKHFLDRQSQSPSPPGGLTHSNPPQRLEPENILDQRQQAEYFKGCILVERMNRIVTGEGRFMDTGTINSKFGGKLFIIDQYGKTTDEPWKAATRGRLFTVPKVDHLRFLPSTPKGALITDELGRKGINTYIPAIVETKSGDITLFLNHLELLLPNERDRAILLSFLAHNVQRPGVKIPWAPVIQSTEGAGKNVLKIVMKHALGDTYVYDAKSDQLSEGGGKFNAWMRSRLMIIADEIKTDDRRNLIEILKPMISEERIEIQGKGVDQEMEDNVANWLAFTNWRDALPVNENSRRWAIFYSAIQSVSDLIKHGMDEGYFQRLYSWLRTGGGKEAVAHYLMNYHLGPTGIPMRAPRTSSTDEAIIESRGPIEQIIVEAIDSDFPGFRGGWISTTAANRLLKERGIIVRSPRTLGNAICNLGYVKIGQATKPYFHEDPRNRTYLYNRDANENTLRFGQAQGYE